ncbi:MAG: hybrid sensor histidine kinase/response regulator [Steroidobacteraceae bacterium]
MTDKIDFRRLFEESPDNILVLLPDAPRYTMVAATHARLNVTHTSRGQIEGRGLFEVFPDDPSDPGASGTRNLRASLDRVVATRAPDTMAVQKYDIPGQDGTFVSKYWSPKNIPVLAATGEILYILHRVEDVTDLVRTSESGEGLLGSARALEREVVARSRELGAANEALREATEKLRELDRAKTEFFSNVSHEFRTPLTLMLGPLEDALADRLDMLSPAQRTRITLAHDNALRLLKLVNALLDFARIQAGRTQARFVPVDLAQLTAELAGMFESAITRGSLSLHVDCPGLAQPAWVDRDMWEKIVLNLISNAFKFTREGSITVSLREEADKVVFQVIDTGIGIAANELPRIFERFHRVSGAQGRAFEGTGIGLALVRELVELHGGSVSASSVAGQGTTFRVELRKGFAHLPSDSVQQHADEVRGRQSSESAAHVADAHRWMRLNEVPAVAERPSDSVSSARRPRILVIDDNVDLREYMSALLSPTYEVSTASDGREGLAIARTSSPDLILSDVMMPELSGIELVAALRADPRCASIPVILLSARAGQEAAIEGLDAGADDYLVKPFSAPELLARVNTHVQLALKRREWANRLESANRELDAFTHSVAHDLRAPLRGINGMTEILYEGKLQQLDADGQKYLRFIRESGTRMAQLIEDLLKLSRVTRADMARHPLDLSSLVSEVARSLQDADPVRNVEFVILDGVRADGDMRLLRVALENLLGNAWKFTGKKTKARIEFGREDRDGDSVYFVRDNGAGFDMAYAGKLFQVFQRMHAMAEFEGSGVGLATVQRIVSRHGGRIWADSSVNEGTTFFFTLAPGATSDRSD